MGLILMSTTLLVSSVIVYNWSYKFLWFKLALLFNDATVSTKTSRSSIISSINGYENSETDTFVQKFYTEYSLSSKKLVGFIRTLFSVAMVCYIITIEIVLWQIKSVEVDQGGDFITEWVWSLVAMSLSLILILVQPFFILVSLLNKFFNDRFDLDRLIIITSTILITLIAILRLLSIGPFQYSQNILTRLSISGVTIMAILSGIASVSTIYYTFLYFWIKHTNKKMPSTVSKFASNGLRSKKLLIWARKSWIKERLIKYEAYRNLCIQELNRLETAELPNQEMQRQKDNLLESIAQSQLQTNLFQSILDESPKIRLARKFFEIGFLVYCVYRVTLTFFVRIPKIISHFIDHPLDYQFEHFSASSDPLAVTIANILDFCLFNFNYQHDLDSLTSQISLFLSASLFICAFSTVSTTVSFLVSLLPARFQVLAFFALQNEENANDLPIYGGIKQRKYNEPSMIKNLLLSELAGVYVVATVLMIRSNLPFDVAERLKDMLGQKFTVTSFVIDCWFDEIYAISCILTIFFIKLAERTVYHLNMT
ncbi:similar to Saccharomyces cerevisiae YHR078W High osmolarity-regulated gene of unknown function [Maudiozyma saulgeensis]|uniref:Abscisic acid G-protein coupled receptor-like domain-containing protein n=1 Tax=Maudiozyma saulgeensis TaxID=1789683 RepID=A0A1X7QYY7_9SACH|nr:similar to Saccharomyces cerevisiae YHR078W High osmolarity-regulated gene of unknown function [Kazachstania saulgeensis]